MPWLILPPPPSSTQEFRTPGVYLPDKRPIQAEDTASSCSFCSTSWCEISCYQQSPGGQNVYRDKCCHTTAVCFSRKTSTTTLLINWFKRSHSLSAPTQLLTLAGGAKADEIELRQLWMQCRPSYMAAIGMNAALRDLPTEPFSRLGQTELRPSKSQESVAIAKILAKLGAPGSNSSSPQNGKNAPVHKIKSPPII